MKPICKNCKEEIVGRKLRKYCSNACQGAYTYNISVSEWKSGKRLGHLGKTMGVAPFVRRYLYEKYNSKCCKCGWNTPHSLTGKPPLDVNHIDGNPSNTIEKNLELICPNCHSLTLTYKNRNKGNGRKFR